jgi:Arc/MetJ-type ribon-helix-helix transcriptional regulator
MTITLTPEQERRIQAVIGRGSFTSVDELMDAALAALEERTATGFEGSDGELEAALAVGLASDELTEEQFWQRVNSRMDSAVAEHNRGRHS